jgi:hypothetical protein
LRPEPAGVWLADGRPARFVWRGRLYTVLSVVARPVSGRQAGSDVPELADVAGTQWECWRVTASPGKNVPAMAFQLCHDPAADRWLLSRDY